MLFRSGIESKAKINPAEQNEDTKTKKRTPNNLFPIKIVTETVPKLDLSSINELGNLDAKESENSEDPSPIAAHAEEKKFEGDQVKIPDPMLDINSEIPKENKTNKKEHPKIINLDMCENPRRSAVIEIHKPAHLGPTVHIFSPF